MRLVPRGLSALFLCLLGGTQWQLGCCPDAKMDECLTLDQWRAKGECKNFPAPPAGTQCPSAAAVAKSCDTDPGPSHADGDKCCYTMPLPCY